MTKDLFHHDDDATPLDPDECDGLKPSHIATRAELNAAEQQNILQAELFVLGRRFNPLDEAAGRRLHKRMFGDVWTWAGNYRKSNKNIGVEKTEITTRLYQLIDDVKYWIDNKVYAEDEIAARLHHGLVFIHPFPNGNGRWSRLMTNSLLRRLGRPEFAFGIASASADQRDERTRYVAALKAADNYDLTPLIAFLRPPDESDPVVGGKIGAGDKPIEKD